MRLSERWRRAASPVVFGAFAAALGGCGVHSLTTPDGGGAGGGAGTGIIVEPPNPLLSDFEDPALAVITRNGGRNGVWYAYNDGANGCTQMPAPAEPYRGEAPPTLAPGTSGSRALHAVWTGCTTWGAGVGADLDVPLSPDGGAYAGPRVPYDLSAHSGLTFWAMAARGTDVNLRFKMVTRASTAIADGGTCDENVVGAGKCGDDWGELFQLPADGSWYPVKINFASPSFHQEGWGAAVDWDARDVVGIQIQSVDAGSAYDLWIDDMYLLP